MRGACLALALLAGAAQADPAATAALNGYRVGKGRSALVYSGALEAAARAHATDMAKQGFFGHQGSRGSSVGDRVRKQGYGWCVVAENIAKGQKDLGEVMRAWGASAGHRKNMLNREVTEFALVGGKDRLWVMVLAAPGC